MAQAEQSLIVLLRLSLMTQARFLMTFRLC
jgi:hypothetical protein